MANDSTGISRSDSEHAERERLVAQIHELTRELMAASAHPWHRDWSELDLTIGQLKALFCLAEDAPMRMSVLAHRLGIALPSCTGLADRLTKSGLVERHEDPSDRRLVLCKLSERGKALVAKLHQTRDIIHDELLRCLTTEELRTVALAVTALCRGMSETNAVRSQLPSAVPSPAGPRRQEGAQ